MAGQHPVQQPARPIAAISRQPESAPFQAAAAEGRFVVPHCSACDRTHWYPRALCPFCFSDDLTWQDASGHGTVYSYTVMRRAKPAYAIAYVQLKEGPTMMSNIVGCDLDTVHIGMAVKLVFEPAENGPLVPMFQPV